MQFLIDRTMSVIRSEGVGWEVNVLNYNSKFVSKERTCCSITFPSFLSQNLFSIKQKIIHGVTSLERLIMLMHENYQARLFFSVLLFSSLLFCSGGWNPR